MRSAAIYARVSTADQADTGTSLESQTAACQKYAEANGYTVLATFKESRSGASLNRPMLDQVREMARNKEIDAVIFYALDRLSRDETDTLILAREWRGKDVELKCATVPLEDTPQGQFLLTMLAAVGKLERAGILERTMRGKRQTIKNGRIVRPASDMFGYYFEDGAYKLNEAEAEWVRKIYHWYVVEGVPLIGIVARLNASSVRCKQKGNWAASSVRTLLSNEAYTGKYYWGKKETHKDDTGHRTWRHVPHDEWIGPIDIPLIIAPSMFSAARERIEYNKQNCKRGCQLPYLLRSMTFCELCGHRLVGDKTTNRSGSYTYYRCYTHRGFTRPVNGRRAEEKVWAWVMEHLSNPDLIIRALQTEDAAESAQRERDDAAMKQLVGMLADLDRREDKDIELYEADGISLDKFKQKAQSIREARESNEARIAEIEERAAQRARARDDILSVKELCETIQAGLPLLEAELTFEEKRRIMAAMHVKVTAKPDGNILVTGRISEDLLMLAPAQAPHVSTPHNHVV